MTKYITSRQMPVPLEQLILVLYCQVEPKNVIKSSACSNLLNLSERTRNCTRRMKHVKTPVSSTYREEHSQRNFQALRIRHPRPQSGW